MYEHSVYVAVNHVFLDGIGASRLVCIVLDEDPNDLSVVPRFRYAPGLTECLIASKALPMLAHLPKRHFSYDVPWDEYRAPHFRAHYSAEQADFARMKRALESCNGGQCGYAASIVSLVALFLLAHSDKGEVSIGLTTSFQSDEDRFNSVSVVFLRLRRESNWHRTDDYVRLVLLSRQVNCALRLYGKEQALGVYVLTNYYGFYGRSHDPGNRGRANSGPQQVDCTVSCGTLRFPMKCNGKPATLERVEMFGTSMPVYVGAYTCNDRFHVDMYARTFELAVDDSTPFILSRLVASLPPEGVTTPEIDSSRRTSCSP